MNKQAIDIETLKKTQQQLGGKFPLALEYYLEDSPVHLRALKQALEEHQWQLAILPAHSLKSASKQFGLQGVASPAEQLEQALRVIEQGKDPELKQAKQLYLTTAQEFLNVRPTLQRLMRHQVAGKAAI